VVGFAEIRIQQDGTEAGVAERLVEAGIPREHIVLAFKPPEIRQHTGFAAARVGKTASTRVHPVQSGPECKRKRAGKS
jgi:hypothetical protein